MIHSYRLHLVVAIGATLSSALAQSPIPTQFRAVDLGGLPGAFNTSPEGINDAGTVVGWTQGPAALFRAFVWRPETGMVELPPPPGYTDNRAMDVSENGIICGSAQNGVGGTPRAWRWINGTYELLPPTAGGCVPVLANAVNDDGSVVGTGLVANASCPNMYAFYFSDVGGTLGLSALSAIDINNAGVATGEGFGSAYRYTPATGFQLIGELPNDDTSEGRAINEAGNVTGRSINHLTGPDTWRSFYYSPSAGIIQISTGQARSSGEGLNVHEHAVGNDGTSSTPDQHPYIWSSATGRVSLPPLVILDPNVCCVDSARGINDHDMIIAKALRTTGPQTIGIGVLLVPVSDPRPFCSGDGSGTPCPCGNAGATGNGCANSLNQNGANLSTTGAPSVAADSLQLLGSGMPDSSALYFQGTTQVSGGAGATFGDGLRCAGGAVRRLGTKLNVGGASQYPASGDLPISVVGATHAGEVRTYQVWYRNAAAFCTTSTFNLTNGVEVTWRP